MEGTSCAICLEDLKVPVSVPCGHIHCEQCLIKYIRASPNPVKASCPTCRVEFYFATPELRIVPGKYHPYLNKAIRRVYIPMNQTFTELVRGLRDENGKLENVNTTLKRERAMAIDNAVSSFNEAVTARLKERAANEELNKLKKEIEEYKQRYGPLRLARTSTSPPDQSSSSSAHASPAARRTADQAFAERRIQVVPSDPRPNPKRARLSLPQSTGGKREASAAGPSGLASISSAQPMLSPTRNPPGPPQNSPSLYRPFFDRIRDTQPLSLQVPNSRLVALRGSLLACMGETNARAAAGPEDRAPGRTAYRRAASRPFISGVMPAREAAPPRQEQNAPQVPGVTLDGVFHPFERHAGGVLAYSPGIDVHVNVDEDADANTRRIHVNFDPPRPAPPPAAHVAQIEGEEVAAGQNAQNEPRAASPPIVPMEEWPHEDDGEDDGVDQFTPRSSSPLSEVPYDGSSTPDGAASPRSQADAAIHYIAYEPVYHAIASPTSSQDAVGGNVAGPSNARALSPNPFLEDRDVHHADVSGEDALAYLEGDVTAGQLVPVDVTDDDAIDGPEGIVTGV